MAKYLFFIVIIAGLFRFWQLTAYPTSLTMDEVAIGYGSYSLLHTGKDDKGQVIPLAFKSVGDYKPPVNYYLDVVSIFVFDMSELAVRLPVAILGSLTVVVFAIFLRKLGLSKSISLFGGLWLAIVPWHVHHSRYGLEAVTALFFLLTGATSLLNAFSKKSYSWLVLSLVSFSLSVWAYHSNRLFVPLFSIFLVSYKFSELKFIWRSKSKAVITGLIFCLFALPFLYLTFTSPAIKQRAAMTSILREQSLMLSLHKGEYNSFAERIFDNDAYLIFHHWLGKYTDYFDLRFWFWRALTYTPPGYPDSGLLYVIDLPLFVAGVYALIKSRNKFLKSLTIFWFFVGPLASSFTMNDQHTLRTLVWLPFFGIVTAMGFGLIFAKYKFKFLLIYLALLLFNVAYIKDLYVHALPRYFSEYWQYGFKEAAIYSCEHQDEYDRIVISPVFGTLGPLTTGIPDYYVLFYCKYPPQKYMSTNSIEKFEFVRVDWRGQREAGGRALLISAKWDYPLVTAPEEYVIKRIDYPNELPAFYFVDTAPKR